jgi:uncharacterized protein
MDNNNLLPEEEPKNRNKLEPTMSPTKAAILGLISVFFIFQFGGGLLALSIFGFDINNADMNLMRLLTIGSQILFILFPAILFAKLVFIDVTSIVRLHKPKLREIGLFVIGMIILIPLMQDYLHIQNYLINEFSKSSLWVEGIKNFLDELDKYVEQSYSQLLSSNNIFEMILIIITVSITPAICEEFFFRGFVQGSLEYKLKPFTAIFITSFFFGVYHFNPYGLLPLIALGMYLGFSVYQSNSLIVSVVLHFLNNFISIVAYFIFGDEELMQTNFTNTESINAHAISFIILLVLFVTFIIFIKKNYRKLIDREVENDLSTL